MENSIDSKAKESRGTKRKYEYTSDTEEPALDPIEYDKLYEDLITDCSSPIAGSGFSDSVRTRLEKCKPDLRNEIVSMVKKNLHPLFLACWYEKMEIVEYLITHCNADVNKRGKLLTSIQSLYSTVPRIMPKMVSPLWIAAVFRRNLPMVKFLISHGANVNAYFGMGNTVIQELCLSRHDETEIFTYLVQNGADIHKRFLLGETCLMKCLHKRNKFLILLKHGADINARDSLFYSILHKAIVDDNLDTIKFLLFHNANPYMRGRNNDDALQAACTNDSNDSLQAFDYLVKNVFYSPETLADAYELVGSMFAYRNENDNAFEFWKKSLDIRKNSGLNGRLLPNNFGIITKMIFPNAKEVTTIEELNMIITDLNAIRMQTLISFERILGLSHHITIKMLEREITSYNWSSRIYLWRRILEILVEQDRILIHQCIGFIELLDSNFMNIYKYNIHKNEELKFSDFTAIFESLVVLMSKSILVLEMDARREIPTDCILNCFILIISHVCLLITLLLEIAQTEKEDTEIGKLVWKLVHSTSIGYKHIKISSLILHCSILCIGIFTFRKTSFFLKMLKLLIDCGADVNARNISNSSPLLSALRASTDCKESQSFFKSVVKLFLDYGAHIDSPDLVNTTEPEVLKLLGDINLMDHMSLKCFAAQVICKYGIQYTELPAHLHYFIKCHK